MIRQIVTVPNLILQKKAKPVKKFDKTLQDLFMDMEDTMRYAEGIGIAAVQVNVDLQCAVVDVDEYPKLYMSNPELIIVSEEESEYEEGCLSLPTIQVPVVRPKNIKVRFQDILGKEQIVVVNGLYARCIMHEIDHLQGILISNRLSPLKRRLAFKKVQKHERR